MAYPKMEVSKTIVCVELKDGVHVYAILSMYCPFMYTLNSFLVAAVSVTGLYAAAPVTVTVVAEE
jgi:hypothetical protein